LVPSDIQCSHDAKRSIRHRLTRSFTFVLSEIAQDPPDAADPYSFGLSL